MSAEPVAAKMSRGRASAASMQSPSLARRKALAPSKGKRPWTFYALATLFTAYVLALYGPMLCIYILSFQDVRGDLVFPVRGFPSLYWFDQLFSQAQTGDIKGAFNRSISLAILVTVLTVVISFLSGLAFRRKFRGDTAIFTMMIGSLVAPGLVLGIGVGLLFNALGLETHWYSSALGAHLSWTLPFGVLVMFAVMSRFDHVWEEASRDLGASRWQTIRLVMIPVLAPGLVAVALFGFTLSYDEFARSVQTAGALNTLPLEIWSMTLNITSPSLYALGTVTTLVSFIIIVASLYAIGTLQKRRAQRQASH
jgi:putative spermidine/putrescine transport system permease protein